jgi:hypothetical protein
MVCAIMTPGDVSCNNPHRPCHAHHFRTGPIRTGMQIQNKKQISKGYQWQGYRIITEQMALIDTKAENSLTW